MSEENPILKNLNDKQLEAVMSINGPLLVIAGAGSGKTRALTHRIAYMIQNGISPWNILAVTFTNKAANEMKGRIIKLIGKMGDRANESTGLFANELTALFGAERISENAEKNETRRNSWTVSENELPTVGTFHAICVRILRKHIHHLGYEDSFVIYDDADQQILMKKLMEDAGIDDKKMNPRSVLGAISNAKSQLIDEEQFRRYADNMFMEKVAMLYPAYQKSLRQSNALDFDDIINKTVELFKNFPEILDFYQEKFKYISVDEYQDTNHAQYVLIGLLAAKYRNLCVIGDEDQSIYSWRGATIKNILEFEKDYPDARVVMLEQNYRSTKNILDAAHHIISKNRSRKEKKLWTEKQGGAKIKRLLAHNERHEGELIATNVVEILKEYESPQYSDFVVLYRTNAQSRVLEEVFLRFGLPYKIVGGIKFYDRKEIKDMIAYLRVIQNPNDSVSLQRIINVPARKIGARTLEVIQNYALKNDMSLFSAMRRVNEISDLSDSKISDIEKFVKLIEELKKANTNFPAAGVIKHVLAEAKYKEFLDDGTSEGEERLLNVQELISVASKYDSLEPGASLAIFLEEISLISDLDKTSSDTNAVTFMTVHSAKGLEFPHVFIAGLEDGIFPHNRSLMDPSELEEERRLMYVAMTRAMESLHLLHAMERMLYGEFRSNPPSQFFDDIPAELVDDNFGGHAAPLNKRRFGFGARFGGGFKMEPVVDYSTSGLGKNPVPYENPEYEETGVSADSGRGFGGVKASESIEDQEYNEVAYEIGDRVEHGVFGSGIVVQVQGGVVTVAFNDSKIGVKKLAISVAPLKKI